MFLYQKIDNHIKILGCLGYGGEVQIPERIGNDPVTELADYLFHDGAGRSQMLSLFGDLIQVGEEDGTVATLNETKQLPIIKGENLKELYLPETIEKIGNYAFYNCYELKKIVFKSSISDLGSGLFTGCHNIRELDIHIVDGVSSCMKDVISELRQELYVNYNSSQGNAKLLFPEMFEESVEHTPARVVLREMHGCGHRYRYCFDHTEFQFHKYDALFPYLRVQHSRQTVATLVLLRLSTPIHILREDKKAYETYLDENMQYVSQIALELLGGELFLWLAKQYAASSERLDYMVDLAVKSEKTELLSTLMDLRRKRFPAKKRSFSL
ncbi:leucine-rich repeat domain-containing protein [Clostridium sp. E02]|uniref:leucine-rich repeat domain-containing protein n=1 Tax=Clostridium sp. E02 TaxID=2487134 RepID=UPI000F52F040|nr:leucine-rich repeat domain-containing protein [Clostridium sp. E02]